MICYVSGGSWSSCIWKKHESVCDRDMGVTHIRLAICYWLVTLLQVVDCRVCGDPNSVLRFAFVEFTDEGMGMWIDRILFKVHCDTMNSDLIWHVSWNLEYVSDYSTLWWWVEGARAALCLAGTMLGYYPVRVLPSKTAIVPVNPTFLPRVSFVIQIVSGTLVL